MATINHKKYDEATETFKDFYVYDGKETLIFKVDGENHKVEITGTLDADNITGSGIIKTSDNGPISGTAKYLSDGLGNDSALALSTARVAINTTSDYSFNDDAKLVVANASGNSTITIASGSASTGYLAFADGTSGTARYTGSINYSHSADAMTFHTNQGAERMRIDSSGNVGIGTTTPYSASGFTSLDINGTNGSLLLLRTSGTTNLSIGTSVGNPTIKAEAGKSLSFYTDSTQVANITSNGITFGSDTAAANALDDYEEGTWTPQLTINGSAVGITYNIQAGRYTKIGRVVTVNGYFVLSSKGTNTGAARIGGLPFTVPFTNEGYSACSIYNDGNLTYTGQMQAFTNINSTSIVLSYVTEAGIVTNLSDSNFANNSSIMLSVTYFV